jgi:hypothetical protein
MMGGGTFILLKTGCYQPESAKQAEIRLAILLKILRIGGRPQAAVTSGDNEHVLVATVRIPPDMPNSPDNALFVI